jgi:hypothetical protein
MSCLKRLRKWKCVEFVGHRYMGSDYPFPCFGQNKIQRRGPLLSVPQFRVEYRELNDEERPL